MQALRSGSNNNSSKGSSSKNLVLVTLAWGAHATRHATHMQHDMQHDTQHAGNAVKTQVFFVLCLFLKSLSNRIVLKAGPVAKWQRQKNTWVFTAFPACCVSCCMSCCMCVACRVACAGIYAPHSHPAHTSHGVQLQTRTRFAISVTISTGHRHTRRMHFLSPRTT